MLCRILCLSVCLVGCAPSWEKNPTREYPYWVSPRFSSQHQGEIAQAFRSWEVAVNGYLSFQSADYASASIRIQPATMNELANHNSHEGPSYKCMGHCEYDGPDSEIGIATDIRDSQFQWVALHEVGHALGLQHTSDGTLMCKVDSCASPTITGKDLEQFRTIWHGNF